MNSFSLSFIVDPLLPFLFGLRSVSLSIVIIIVEIEVAMIVIRFSELSLLLEFVNIKVIWQLSLAILVVFKLLLVFTEPSILVHVLELVV